MAASEQEVSVKGFTVTKARMQSFKIYGKPLANWLEAWNVTKNELRHLAFFKSFCLGMEYGLDNANILVCFSQFAQSLI